MADVPMRVAFQPPRTAPLAGTVGPGLHRIAPPPAFHGRRAALALVPPGLGSAPAALIVLLHGSGGEPDQAVSYLEPFASAASVLVLAPASRDYTWDAILGRAGPDVEAVNHALRWAFERFIVDRARLAVGGFSDGASYALGLGVANGDVFSSTVALSPGFIPAGPAVGKVRAYISHGVADAVLPIERCSRRIVPELRRSGHDVAYEEFDDGHMIPPRIARRACSWMLGAEPTPEA